MNHQRIRNRAIRIGFLAFAHIGCGTAEEQPTGTVPVPEVDVALGAPLVFEQIEDNLQHDTLLIQTTFDLMDGTFVMVARNVEETFDGLRLYRYRLNVDGSSDILAISGPAYDSWTMLPTFFPVDPAGTDALWVLANFGERESWGQKLIHLGNGFTDLGFMDVALPERVEEDDTLRLKRRNIAPYMRSIEVGDTAFFRFVCDSVYLYDDQDGGYDLVRAASQVHYTYHPAEGLSLWIDGRKRPVKQPA